MLGVSYDDVTDRSLSAMIDYGRVGGWLFPYRGIAFVSDRPERLCLDDRPFPGRRLHALDGPAMRFRDGYELYAVHGVRVPAQVVLSPETLTPTQIHDESNVEVRRVMLERFGLERYLREIGATVMHRDDWGTLYRSELPDDEPLLMVEVVNSTPEPDGSCKNYWLRVPPEMRTARQAVAWTFREEEQAYAPKVQT